MDGVRGPSTTSNLRLIGSMTKHAPGAREA
jgi:hypothetical protein